MNVGNILLNEIKFVVRPKLKSIKLLKECISTINKLPEDTKIYYHNYLRTNFDQYSNETDDERVEEIIENTSKQLEWIRQKYNVK